MTPEKLRERRRERRIVWPASESDVEIIVKRGRVEIDSWFDVNGVGWGQMREFDEFGRLVATKVKPTGVKIVCE